MARFITEQINHVKQVVERLNIRQSNDSPADTVTQQYGFIQFNEDELDETFRPCQYIRLALRTDAETVVKFMKEAWHLPTPDLIISISGGTKHSELSARVRKAFQIGLVSAAATTNAWLITAGTNAGVVKEVGEALNKYRYKNQTDGVNIPCIGIGSWGYTAEKQQLDRSVPRLNSIHVNNSKIGRRNLIIDALNMNGDAIYGIRKYIVPPKEDKRCDLEPNHTHFLLFDDGEAKADCVLPLRADIEKYSRRSNIRGNIERTVQPLIPIVLVLLEGGRSSVQNACEALGSDTPVVVVKGSGRAADLVADLYAYFSKQFNENFIGNADSVTFKHRDCSPDSSFLRMESRTGEINIIFNKARLHSPWVDELREELCKILSERHQLITIFDFDDQRHEGKLEEAILEAVFNAAKFCHQSNEEYQSAAQLKLSLAWHNVTYARQVIFTDEINFKWKDEDLRQGLVDALRRGYTDFIELFLEYGISFDKLTVKDLAYLYSTASVDDVLPLENGQGTVPTREEFYSEYIKHHLQLYQDKTVSLGDHAVRDLFFWALFLDRFDFAVYLCSKSWDQCTALLFGARIYRKAAKMTLDSESTHMYQKNADQFDKYAASVIDRCFESDRDFAIGVLQRPAIAFYNVEPLQIALKGTCRAFLASHCVQKYLDNEWFGNINYKRPNVNLRIFLCSLFFPLLPIFYGTLPYLHRHQPLNRNTMLRINNLNTPTNSISKRHVQWNEKIMYFYRAPIVRFYYNLIFFFVFLGLFSYVLLVDYFPLNVFGGTRSGIRNLPLPITEICLHIFVWGIIMEEGRQFARMRSLTEYLSEVSNLIDMTGIILYLIGFITRFIVIEECFMVSKIVLGLDLILWYIRILHLFAAYERLGPKLIMIFNTMKDLIFFVCFILIFLFGFSITSWSLIITSSQVEWVYDDQGQLMNITLVGNETNTLTWKLVRDMTHYGVWKVFGQVDIIDNNNPYSAVAFVLAILFVAISNVLLLNVLVALFNVTIQNVRDQSHTLWRYQRFLLINEFRNKSLLPIPLCPLYCVICLIIQLINRQRKQYRNHMPINTEQMTVDSDEATNRKLRITDLMKRENAIAEDFWRELLKQNDEKAK